MADFLIRPAKEDESGLVLDFIKQIAAYEKLSHLVEATEHKIHESLFVNHDAKAIIAFENDIPVGFALYYYNFSTFKGKKGLYLEDLFVKEEHRHKGYGKALITYLIRQASIEKVGRMEWACLDWNQTAAQFYLSLGAKPMDGWTIFRLDEKDLGQL
jgi:GNAT superfamily N-acetyltransferase